MDSKLHVITGQDWDGNKAIRDGARQLVRWEAEQPRAVLDNMQVSGSLTSNLRDKPGVVGFSVWWTYALTIYDPTGQSVEVE